MYIDTLKSQFGYCQFVTQLNLKDLEPSDTFLASGENGNCINWVLGHILASRDHLLELMGCEPVFGAEGCERYKNGSAAVHGPEDGVEHARLSELFEQSQAAVEAGLDAFDPARFAEEVSWVPGGERKEPLGKMLPGLIFHEAYHAGQIGIIRRLIGKDSVAP